MLDLKNKINAKDIKIDIDKEKIRKQFIKTLIENRESAFMDRAVREYALTKGEHIKKHARKKYLQSAACKTKIEEMKQSDHAYQRLSMGQLTESEEKKLQQKIDAKIEEEKRKARHREKFYAFAEAHGFSDSESLQEVIENVIEENKEEIEENAARQVIEYFMTEHMDVMMPRKSYGQLYGQSNYYRQNGSELQQDGNIDEFLDDLYEYDGIEDLIIEITDIGENDQPIFDLIYEKLPWLKECEEYTEELGEGCGEIVAEAVCEYNLEILSVIEGKFPKTEAKRLVLANPLYKDIRDAELRKAEIQTQMLTSIPDDYIDLYPAARLLHREFVIHAGPTNSGKTHDAVECLKTCSDGAYLAPLRLLAYEQFDSLNKSGVICSLLTGEEHEDLPGSTVTASTIEMLKPGHHYDAVVIDEAQMISDPDRGGAWTAAILGVCADHVEICCAPEAVKRICGMISSCGDSYTVVWHERKVPLVIQKEQFEYPADAEAGDAFVVFSRRDVHSVASELGERGLNCSVIYGALPYDVRHKQAELFAKNEGGTDVVVATDAIGMGMNLPIKRIIFLSMEKYNGKERVPLPPGLIRQIAGRAGRYGIYDKGIVAATNMGDKKLIKTALSEKPNDIKKAVMDFPRSLLGISGPLSELLKQWGTILPKEGFEMSDVNLKIELAKELENISDQKDLVYRFIQIPFSERDPYLCDLWTEMYRTEKDGRHFDITPELNRIETYLKDTGNTLDDLEGNYRVCDLIYHYVYSFFSEEEKDKMEKWASVLKGRLSEKMMNLLSQMKLNRRKCSRCGKVLPWNYPHGMCEKCHSKEVSEKRAFYDYRQREGYPEYDDNFNDFNRMW